ncbi:MAG: CRISPR-associated protein Csx11 [Candidatus Viridilinea halotolerans]|uniref:CRISPR-associated protein Csx11 n=1 Tax=Candidatus Viridilinea halotolerans TaxID=2491704 RepID=A0A426TUK4_9CHLR|nr:MAG: CRISPR-associated protein Csx11 [Candidatus Viridilinea halotolerans]
MSQLEILAQHRDALLLAEAIGWLHDYRKCSDEQLKVQAANKAPKDQALPRSEATDPNSLSGRYNILTSTNLQLPVQSNARTVTNLFDDNTWRQDLLGLYLSRCHNTAHFDKQDPAGGKQSYPGIQISSPFGFERPVLNDLTSKMWALPWASLATYSKTERQNLFVALRNLFPQVGADTRRPTNEVDLWSWGLLVGALYKTALAGALLSASTPPDAQNLHWRLLSVRVDGLGYLFNAARLPDLLSRQELLHDAFARVCSLLEETYPLANEVYRDEHGSLYVVPDLPGLLGLTNSQGVPLSQLILQEFAKATLKGRQALQLGGEITPVLVLEPTPWWGQDPNRSGSDELPAINAMLSPGVRAQADAEAIEAFWNSRIDAICTVCGLRPQGPARKAIERNVCNICEQRRLDRSQAWASEQSHETIWIDEVADTNGRLTLIVGQFDLEGWLEGRLLDSLLVIAPNEGTTTTKTASFSRVQRIWQTTRQFWREVQAWLDTTLSDDRRRVLLYLDQEPDLGPFHVYELDLGSTSLSVVWYPPQADGSGGYLISADNLNAVARRLGAERHILEDAVIAAIWLEDYLQQQFMQQTRQLILHNPEATPGKRQQNLLAGRRLIRTEHQDTAYSTAIPILAEPRSFMALVPANRSLDILQQIKLKYEREMGKVRNRLPLQLSAVYFSRRTPLRAALDAGQAMLKRKTMTTVWNVRSVVQGSLPADTCDPAKDRTTKPGPGRTHHAFAIAS